MKLLVLVLITLFLSVPSYAKDYSIEFSQQIILEGKILSFVQWKKGTHLAVNYNNRLYSCVLFVSGADPHCSTHTGD